MLSGSLVSPERPCRGALRPKRRCSPSFCPRRRPRDRELGQSVLKCRRWSHRSCSSEDSSEHLRCRAALSAGLSARIFRSSRRESAREPGLSAADSANYLRAIFVERGQTCLAGWRVIRSTSTPAFARYAPSTVPSDPCCRKLQFSQKSPLIKFYRYDYHAERRFTRKLFVPCGVCPRELF